jgi:hypothetical protein
MYAYPNPLLLKSGSTFPREKIFSKNCPKKAIAQESKIRPIRSPCFRRKMEKECFKHLGKNVGKEKAGIAFSHIFHL